MEEDTPLPKGHVKNFMRQKRNINGIIILFVLCFRYGKMDGKEKHMLAQGSQKERTCRF